MFGAPRTSRRRIRALRDELTCRVTPSAVCPYRSRTRSSKIRRPLRIGRRAWSQTELVVSPPNTALQLTGASLVAARRPRPASAQLVVDAGRPPVDTQVQHGRPQLSAHPLGGGTNPRRRVLALRCRGTDPYRRRLGDRVLCRRTTQHFSMPSPAGRPKRITLPGLNRADRARSPMVRLRRWRILLYWDARPFWLATSRSPARATPHRACRGSRSCRAELGAQPMCPIFVEVMNDTDGGDIYDRCWRGVYRYSEAEWWPHESDHRCIEPAD